MRNDKLQVSFNVAWKGLGERKSEEIVEENTVTSDEGTEVHQTIISPSTFFTGPTLVDERIINGLN